MNRDDTGNQIKPGPLKGSYAEYRLEKLKELRKQFNVDDLGFYKGGVPRPGKGSVRGDGLGKVGEFHEPYQHNEEQHDRPHIRSLSGVEAQNHKNYMESKD
jgi:hypothetical protein